jgi:hypothetical protein
MPSLLLVLPLGLWLLGVIVVANCASFVVMVACNHCYCWSCFLRGHGCLVPTLLLLLILWLWLNVAICATYFSFVVIVAWHHHYYCYFLHGHGHLAPSMLSFTSRSWLFSAIITTIASFMVMVA